MKPTAKDDSNNEGTDLATSVSEVELSEATTPHRFMPRQSNKCQVCPFLRADEIHSVDSIEQVCEHAYCRTMWNARLSDSGNTCFYNLPSVSEVEDKNSISAGQDLATQPAQELDDEAALELLAGVENDCSCILAKDPRAMCREGKCYHRTGEGHCSECADGYGITVPSLIRAGYRAALAAVAAKEK